MYNGFKKKGKINICIHVLMTHETFCQYRVISCWLQRNSKTAKYHYNLQIQRDTICRTLYDYVMIVW
jgi:hypothetical protein